MPVSLDQVSKISIPSNGVVYKGAPNVRECQITLANQPARTFYMYESEICELIDHVAKEKIDGNAAQVVAWVRPYNKAFGVDSPQQILNRYFETSFPAPAAPSFITRLFNRLFATLPVPPSTGFSPQQIAKMKISFCEYGPSPFVLDVVKKRECILTLTDGRELTAWLNNNEIYQLAREIPIERIHGNLYQICNTRHADEHNNAQRGVSMKKESAAEILNRTFKYIPVQARA